MKSYKEELAERVMIEVESKFLDVVKSVVASLADQKWNTEDLVYKFTAEKIAQRIVNENFDVIASKIDLDRVAKMAEFSAVGKALGQQK